MPLGWSELPTDLLENISRRITTIPDYVRFRSVCSHWRSATPRRPRHLPPQLPWLMVAPAPSDSPKPRSTSSCPALNPPIGDVPSCPVVSFYGASVRPDRCLSRQLPGPRPPAPSTDDRQHEPSRILNLSSGKSYELDLPPRTSRSHLCGSSHGWLLLQDPAPSAPHLLDSQDSPTLCLLHPVTGDRIELPLSNTHRLCFPPFQGSGREHVLRGPDLLPFLDSRSSPGLVTKFVLSSDPSLSSDCVVMAIMQGQSDYLAFCRVGDTSWTILEELDGASDGVGDLTYHGGRFVTVSRRERVACYKAGQPWKAMVYSMELCLRRSNLCLVGNTSGALLMVAWDSVSSYYLDRGDGRKDFCVLKLVFDGQPARWVEVDSIGDSMIFLGRNNQCFALSAAGNFGGSIGKRNHLFYVDGRSEAIRSYSIRDGRSLGLHPVWIGPSSVPLWIAPRITSFLPTCVLEVVSS